MFSWIVSFLSETCGFSRLSFSQIRYVTSLCCPPCLIMHARRRANIQAGTLERHWSVPSSSTPTYRRGSRMKRLPSRGPPRWRHNAETLGRRHVNKATPIRREPPGKPATTGSRCLFTPCKRTGWCILSFYELNGENTVVITIPQNVFNPALTLRDLQ